MAGIQDHPHRYTLANELHARPFPMVQAPCQVAYMAIKPERDAARRPIFGGRHETANLHFEPGKGGAPVAPVLHDRHGALGLLLRAGKPSGGK